MWIGDKYIYTVKTLKAIAENYINIYEGLPLSFNLITNPWSIAEYLADFDLALRGIGKGRWTGNLDSYNFKNFRHYGRLQQIIIADIFGIGDDTLEGLGFWDIGRLKRYAYHLMCKFLNGDT